MGKLGINIFQRKDRLYYMRNRKMKKVKPEGASHAESTSLIPPIASDANGCLPGNSHMSPSTPVDKHTPKHGLPASAQAGIKANETIALLSTENDADKEDTSNFFSAVMASCPSS